MIVKNVSRNRVALSFPRCDKLYTQVSIPAKLFIANTDASEEHGDAHCKNQPNSSPCGTDWNQNL